eukprot:6832134-Pyramimonas_sp.AAC.1
MDFAARRCVHGLRRVGALWFKALLERGLRDVAPPREHGYLRGRSREGAVICRGALLWRRRRADISLVTSREDMANAFGCSTSPSSRDTVTESNRDEDQCYFHQRHE